MKAAEKRQAFSDFKAFKASVLSEVEKLLDEKAAELEAIPETPEDPIAEKWTVRNVRESTKDYIKSLGTEEEESAGPALDRIVREHREFTTAQEEQDTVDVANAAPPAKAKKESRRDITKQNRLRRALLHAINSSEQPTKLGISYNQGREAVKEEYTAMLGLERLGCRYSDGTHPKLKKLHDGQFHGKTFETVWNETRHGLSQDGLIQMRRGGSRKFVRLRSDVTYVGM